MIAVHVLGARRYGALGEANGVVAAAEMRHDIGVAPQIAWIVGLDFNGAEEKRIRIGIAALPHAEQAEIGVVFGVPRIRRDCLLGQAE